MIRCTRHALMIALSCGVTPLLPTLPVEAQAQLSVRGGLAATGTGDRTNCSWAGSMSAGVQARTSGRSFAAVTAAVHVGLPLVCTDAATLVDYGDGTWAVEEGGVHLPLAPRLGARLGQELTAGGVKITASAGGGVLWSTELDGDRATSAQPWYSGSLGAGRQGGRWGLELEAGSHRVEMRHQRFNGPPGLGAPLGVRLFSRWPALVQLSAQRRL